MLAGANAVVCGVVPPTRDASGSRCTTAGDGEKVQAARQVRARPGALNTPAQAGLTTWEPPHRDPPEQTAAASVEEGGEQRPWREG